MKRCRVCTAQVRKGRDTADERLDEGLCSLCFAVMQPLRGLPRRNKHEDEVYLTQRELRDQARGRAALAALKAEARGDLCL